MAGAAMKNRKPSLAICMRLADNLKALRKARGYTQAGLAQRTGFQETYIGNVEQATVNAPLASLEALAEELDCFEEDLLRRKL
jgi:transcriptional regulator with XRE-family HTH domain